ncbi:hypothetical protein LSM04_000160 [Trypanosoma melophagium]|uniref:uncharacterized protein n=1 Tax=Trypanosoma melophagium TaxID=715481 RepID=UPI00351AA250|nr:hypothetical protein LSM04_000160 [Trypanosoma melophagium]
MFFFDTSNQNYGVPNPPVFNQSFPQPGPALAYYPYNELQSCNINGTAIQKQQQQQQQIFAMPQQRGPVMTAPVSPSPLVWTPNAMYNTAPIMGAPDDGVPHFIPAKSLDGGAVSAMQPVFIPPQQPGGGPLVYMLTPVAVQQTYTQNSQQEQQQQQSSNVTPIMHPLVLRDGSTACVTLPQSQSAASTEDYKGLSAANTPDSEDLTGGNKTSKVNVNVVCRHFMKSCCNRRKCRFLHTPEDITLSNF